MPRLRATVGRWKKAVDDAGGPAPDTLSAPAYHEPDSALVADTERLILFSYLVGMDHAATPLDLADDPVAIPFDEAVEFMKARVPLTKDEWKELEAEVRFRAFTVAALSEPDAIERLRHQVIGAVEKGTPLHEFWQAAKLQDAAGLGESPWYWETVYRTNVQTAYNAGRAAEFTRNQPEYLEFVGIEDSRQTDICAERSGTILPASHPFWETNWPPLHFNCRSTVRAVYQAEVDAMREADPDWHPTDDDALSTVPTGKGFGGNPVKTGSFYRMNATMLERAQRYRQEDFIRSFAKSLNLRHDPIETSTIAARTGVVTRNTAVPTTKEGKADYRKQARAVLEEHRNEVFENKELGEGVVFGKTGIDHAVSFAGDPAKLSALVSIPEIIEKAAAFKVEAPDHGDKNIKELLRGKAVIELNGERTLFSVLLKRRIDNGALIFYEMAPWELKK